jgi:hypothetical protein
VNPDDFPYKVVFLTGVDGSGKTHFAKSLIEVLREQGIPVVHVWSRFNNFASKPLLAFTKLIGLNYYEHKGGVKAGYHDFEKSALVSKMFFRLQLLDVWIASIMRFWIPVLRNKVVVADRGPFDTLIDVMVDTKNADLGASRIGSLFLKLIPKPYIVLFLCRDPNKVKELRPDVMHDRNFEFRIRLYDTYTQKLAFAHIDNNGSIKQTTDTLLKLIFKNKLPD